MIDFGFFYSLVNAMIREAGDADGVKRDKKGKLSRCQALPKYLALSILAYLKEEVSVFKSNFSFDIMIV